MHYLILHHIYKLWSCSKIVLVIHEKRQQMDIIQITYISSIIAGNTRKIHNWIYLKFIPMIRSIILFSICYSRSTKIQFPIHLLEQLKSHLIINVRWKLSSTLHTQFYSRSEKEKSKRFFPIKYLLLFVDMNCNHTFRVVFFSPRNSPFIVQVTNFEFIIWFL